MVTQSVARRQPRQHLLTSEVFASMVANRVSLDLTQFSTQQQLNPSNVDRALVRAQAAGLKAMHLNDNIWIVPSATQPGVCYRVSIWSGRLACTCAAGRVGTVACVHRALVAHELSKQPTTAPAPVSIAPAKPATAKITSISQLYDD